jgi:hypothetical protein
MSKLNKKRKRMEDEELEDGLVDWDHRSTAPSDKEEDKIGAMMKKAKDDIYRKYDECEILLIYGIGYNRKEFQSHMKQLWPEDFGDDDDDDFQNDGIRECMYDLQLDYGIVGFWTWRAEDPVFVIGHPEYEILQQLIKHNDKLKVLIPTIDWHYTPGLPVLDKEDMHLCNVNNIERSKMKR